MADGVQRQGAGPQLVVVAAEPVDADARRTQDDMGESPCRANSMSSSSSAGRTRRIVRLRTQGRTDFGASSSWAIQASFDTVGIRNAA